MLYYATLWTDSIGAKALLRLRVVLDIPVHVDPPLLDRLPLGSEQVLDRFQLA